MARQFIGLLDSSVKRQWPGGSVTAFLKNAFKLQTLLVFGALGQAILCLLLPLRLAVLPAAFLGLRAAITTAVQCIRPQLYPGAEDVIHSRVTAQLPDRETGLLGSEPADRPVVVFHLGVQINHPLGLLSPGAREIGEIYGALNKEMQAHADEYGLLGFTPSQGLTRPSNNHLMTTYYFRDVEGLHRFAHDKAHREVWDWWYKNEYKHIGIYHETFAVPRKAYETIYLNMPPVLMGEMRVKCAVPVTDEISEKMGAGSTGGEAWVSSLTSADVEPLKTQYGRMGR